MAVACSVCRKQKVEMRALLGYWRLLDPEGTRSAPRDGNERYKASARARCSDVLHNAASTGTGLSGVKCQLFEAGSWELGACCCWIDGPNPADLKCRRRAVQRAVPQVCARYARVSSDNT
jgi:hypothetical protein